MSGGVKRYVQEKINYLRLFSPGDDHVLIIPGERDEVIESERAKIYTIRSPLISRTSRYRALVRLGAVEGVLESERPDVIESGDPYQVAWKAIASGAALGIPVIGFYHSHFPEAYLRSVAKFFGKTVTEFVMDGARRYVRNLYNRFAHTLVPSPALGALLSDWGVTNVVNIDLGVNTEIFKPGADGFAMRTELGIPPGRTLLLYVGRLAHEKNTSTLFQTFERLRTQHPGRFHLLAIGDGQQRSQLESLIGRGSDVSWLPYCGDSQKLAQIYRAADLFVHPGVQETFGLVALESQACGTPVIGIRGSYMDRIIHSDQTLWARENSAAALAQAIVETMACDLKKIGAAASEHVAQHYSWRQVFDRLFAIYRGVASR
ncbi:MAG: alpha,6-mannosyltransferase [Chthoniobacter sp.]|nr:alpha,6-mannosyltransferase [Chthoniobacter sp.]